MVDAIGPRPSGPDKLLLGAHHAEVVTRRAAAATFGVGTGAPLVSRVARIVVTKARLTGPWSRENPSRNACRVRQPVALERGVGPRFTTLADPGLFSGEFGGYRVIAWFELTVQLVAPELDTGRFGVGFPNSDSNAARCDVGVCGICVGTVDGSGDGVCFQGYGETCF